MDQCKKYLNLEKTWIYYYDFYFKKIQNHSVNWSEDTVKSFSFCDKLQKNFLSFKIRQIFVILNITQGVLRFITSLKASKMTFQLAKLETLVLHRFVNFEVNICLENATFIKRHQQKHFLHSLLIKIISTFLSFEQGSNLKS